MYATQNHKSLMESINSMREDDDFVKGVNNERAQSAVQKINNLRLMLKNFGSEIERSVGYLDSDELSDLHDALETIRTLLVKKGPDESVEEAYDATPHIEKFMQAVRYIAFYSDEQGTEENVAKAARNQTEFPRLVRSAVEIKNVLKGTPDAD